MYEVIWYANNDVILKTSNIEKAIKKLKELELKYYQEYNDYRQRCIDNFDDPTIDEVPGDYYPTYYIRICGSDNFYDITNYWKIKKGKI